MFEFRVLGPIEATRDGRPIDLGPLKQRAVLALLLMNPRRVVATDRILEAVWAGESGKENALWVTISRLRAALADGSGHGSDQILVTRDHGYALEIDPLTIDANRFESLVRDADRSSTDPTEAADLLSAALELWRGEPYEELRYEDFAQSEITRLTLLRDGAAEESCAARLEQGVDAQLIADIDQLVSDRPLSERPVALLMTALYRAGRQADALRAYSRFAERLGEELGLEPSPELRRLEEQVLLHDMGQGAHPSHVGDIATNPYRGLEVFRAQDSGVFFGRDRPTATLLSRIGDGQTLITLVGASGSGKSSIVRAGLIPALRKQSLPSSDRWLVATMVPGAHPFVELETALLRSALDAPSSLGDQLADRDNGVLRAALRVLPDDDSRLVLVIDQLEELFTLAGEDDARDFLEGLVAAASDSRGRIIVVATLRSDFYTHALESPQFGTTMSDGVVNVVPLLPDELEEAATRPAELAGATIEPSLLAALISDILGRPGGLPLFEFALTDLYDGAEDGTMTLAAYREIGGLAGSLTNRAEGLYESLTTQQQEAARQLFLRLVALTEGEEQGRRRVTAAELLQLEIDTLDLQRVIDEFARHRLLTLDRGPTTGEPTVEVAHEALLSEWTRLKGWIDDAREDLRRYASLAVAADEWTRSGNDPDYLWKGRRLRDYEQWAATATIQLTQTDRAFLEESIAGQTLEEEQAHVIERRDRRRSWGLVAAMSTLGIVAIVVAASWLAPEPPRILLVEGSVPDSEIALQFTAGLEQAERDFDIVTDRLFSISDVEGELRQALASGPDLVVLGIDVDTQVDGGARAIAADHPDTRFVLIDGVRRPDDPENLVHFTFATEQGSYLVGLAAALTSRTGVVGFVGGLPISVDSFRAGYEQGARSAGAEVLSTTSLGSSFNIWTAEGFAAEAAERLVGNGADVLYHAIGPAGRGVFETAAGSTSALRTVWAIGVDVDEVRTADQDVSEYILTSMLKRHDQGIYIAIENFLSDVHEDVRLDLASGGVDYSDTGNRLATDVVARVEEAKAAIIDGTVTVRPTPLGPVTAPAPPDHVVMVTANETGCVAAPDGLAVTVQDIVQVDYSNQTAAPILVGIYEPGGSPATVDAVLPGEVSTLSAVARYSGSWTVGCSFAGWPETVDVAALDVTAPPPTSAVDVSFDGEMCEVATDDPPASGEAALVTFRNASDKFAFLSLFRLPPRYTPSDGRVFLEARGSLAESAVDAGAEATAVAVFRSDTVWAASCFSPAENAAFDSQVYTTTG